MDLFYQVAIVAGVVATLYFLIIRPSMKKSIDGNAVLEPLAASKPETEVSSPEAVLVETTLSETEEEKIKRLNELVNPDEDKPFAKISKPDVSEISTEVEQPTQPVEKKRKKRSKKEDK